MTDAKETAQAAIDALGLKIRAQFVPFSQSRNRDEKSPSLNWRVTLVRVHTPGNEAGRDVLTTDYSAGLAHCPSWGAKPPHGYPNHASMWERDAPAWECENGRAAAYFSYAPNGFTPKSKTAPLMPDALDVIYSLVSDASVLDSSSFEEWAAECGYDPDSRQAESIYRACLAIALQLRNAIGDAGLETLRNAFQDY